MTETPRVWNKHWEKSPEDSVYIGRPRGNEKNKWSNPFSHLQDSKAKYKVKNRDEAVDAFEEMLKRAIANHPWLVKEIIRELGGKHLVCWCKPARCHGDVLLRYANPNLSIGENNVPDESPKPPSELPLPTTNGTSPRPDATGSASREDPIQQTDKL